MVRKTVLCFAAAAMVLMPGSPASAGRWHVDDDALPGGSGLSWDNAFQTVQEGIERAHADGGGEVRVAQGWYAGCLFVYDNVSVRGGYVAGTEERVLFSDNGSVLDGQWNGSVVTIGSGTSAATSLDGFTIINGIGTGINHAGGGIYFESSSPTIANNTIRNNDTSGIGGGIGGGIYFLGGSPRIVNNVVRANAARYGAGINGDYSSPFISGNTVVENHATYHAPGIYLYGGDPGASTIANNVVARNVGVQGGGISLNYNSATVMNNTVVRNVGFCSGIYISYSAPYVANNIVAYADEGICLMDVVFTPVLRNNDVYGSINGNYRGLSPGEGDISVDPSFADETGGDYHLAAGSPCINAGSNDFVDNTWTDIDEDPRINIHDGIARVDIGADEFQWPVVLSTNPGNGAIRVGRDIVITVTFSTNIRTVPPDSDISLTDLKRGVTVGKTHSASGKVLTIRPSSPLRAGTPYQVLIQPSSVTDRAGNGMTAQEVFSFTTGK